MIFTLNQCSEFLATIDTTKIIKSHGSYFYNIPMSFDIETTSFYEDKNGVVYTNEQFEQLKKPVKASKKAIMYIWQFAIENNVIYGRTWIDFIYFCRQLYNYLNLEKYFIVVYVHNLSYEFQFICKRFKWLDIFADSERKPIKATAENHFIFKCSYRLSGYSLAVLSNNLQYHKIKKLVGDLDYTLLRNSATPLSEQELEYCFNDVLIVTAYID